ncbi:MAG: hypothetical protein IT424_00655 [Pirellulales bacterium]|nr:hypothetical protein [Pirellulales bacterium]
MMQFADPFCFLALLNWRDNNHAAALTIGAGGRRLLTTEYVLTELADAMAVRTKRRAFVDLFRSINVDADIEIISATPELFAAGIQLYAD